MRIISRTEAQRMSWMGNSAASYTRQHGYEPGFYVTEEGDLTICLHHSDWKQPANAKVWSESIADPMTDEEAERVVVRCGEAAKANNIPVPTKAEGV